MPLPTLPLEIRSSIYEMHDDINLAKYIPEVFEAMAPSFFQILKLGKRTDTQIDNIQTELAAIYPNSGRFARQLTIYPDKSSVSTITKFLEKTSNFSKLEQLRLSFSWTEEAYTLSNTLPFLKLIERVIETSDQLKRLSFNIQPCPSLVDAGKDKITRLDIGYFFPHQSNTSICLPSNLEILTISAFASSYIHGPTPQLRVVIIKSEFMDTPAFKTNLGLLIDRSPLLTSLAIVDACKFFFIRSFFKKNNISISSRRRVQVYTGF
jgi:hypothetical protein